jgi:transcriptional regulator with XRE-family HTH domain
MSKKQMAIALRAQGFTYQQIGDELGCSKQYIAQVLGKQSVHNFHVIKASDCAYPRLAKWMNENKVSRSEFLRRCGLLPLGENLARFHRILRGNIEPRKTDIDRMLKVTGMTYEELLG